MSITLAIGTQIQIASAYGASKAMSVLSNATEAVATLESSHGVGVGDYFEVISGWARATNRVFRAKAVSTNDVTVEGFNTSSTTLYPLGTGIGTVREITSWATITQLTRALQVTGGGQNYADISTLDDPEDKRIPTTRSPTDVTLPIFYDPALVWWPTVETASDTSAPTAVRFLFPNGSKLLAVAYWSLQKVPTIEDSTLRGRIDMSFAGRSTTYAT